MIMSNLKCACTGCQNAATHLWSGHQTCDECGAPSRLRNKKTVVELTTLSDLKAALAEHGMVAVPVEPSKAMIDSLINEWDSCGSCTMVDNYKTMLFAAAQEEG